MNLETSRPGTRLGNADLTERIIGAAIRVHKELGPGFLETKSEEALGPELAEAGLRNDALLFNFATPRLTLKRVGREYKPEQDHEQPSF